MNLIFDESSLNSNNYSSSNDSSSEDINFDVHSYQFKIETKYKNEIHEYSCDPMIYHILNDNMMYTYDPDIALNVEYYSKTYDDSSVNESDFDDSTSNSNNYSSSNSSSLEDIDFGVHSYQFEIDCKHKNEIHEYCSYCCCCCC